jgi:hypothetical protein
MPLRPLGLTLIVSLIAAGPAHGQDAAPAPWEQTLSPITGWPVARPASDDPSGWTPEPLLACAEPDADAADEDCIPAACPPGIEAWWQQCKQDFDHQCQTVCLDFKHMYTGKRLGCLALVVAVAAPLANTHADQSIRDWYVHEVVDRRAYIFRERPVNEFFSRAGDWQITVPLCLGAWAVGSFLDDRPAFGAAGQWGERTLRAMLVGAPATLVLQYGLGGGRPGEGSHWRPFEDANTVAGHGFIGAVPFLTAASMTRCRPLRWTLFAASFGTTWTRMDRDAHYFSQCLIGWSIAYLATQSVSMTEMEMRRVQITPLEMPQGGAGIGVVFRY